MSYMTIPQDKFKKKMMCLYLKKLVNKKNLIHLKIENYMCTFLDPLKHKLINLDIQPSDYSDKLFKSRLTQVNYIK